MPRKVKDAETDEVSPEETTAPVQLDTPPPLVQDLIGSITATIEGARKLGGEVGTYVEAKAHKALAALAKL